MSTLNDTVEKDTAAFEARHGGVGLLKVALSSLNKVLVSKGIVTENELLNSLNDEMIFYEISEAADQPVQTSRDE